MAVESKMMPVGTPLLPFVLSDVDGVSVDIQSFKSKLLLIVFTCNHCPYAKASWPILIELQKQYAAEGLQIIAVNPNNNPDFPDDKFEEMKPYASQIGLNFPYLFDADQTVAKLYGAECTPDPFLFHGGQLAYHGRINDNWKDPAAVQERSLELNILAALGRGAAPPRAFPSMGCSIKWVHPR